MTGTDIERREAGERSALLGAEVPDYQSLGNSEETLLDDPQAKALTGTILVLLIGVFISQADSTLVLSVYGKISSEFQDFENGSWILSAYLLAMSGTQTLYGKLSDIYGRKRCLQTAYVLFSLGTLGTGLGRSMGQVIAARVVQGAGGSGMVGMVSILLTDLVAPRDVAVYRSYVNVIQTLGRMSGGTLGGLLSEAIGWRAAFLIQLLPIVTAIILVEWKLQEPTKPESHADKLKRVDFGGAVSLTSTILAALFVLDMGGQKFAFASPIILGSAVVAFASAVLFVVVEKRAKEPIFPLALLSHHVVVTNYLILALQMLAQMALMFAIPLYFQITRNATPAVAGLYMVPSVVGNTVGGLLTGFFIKKTGQYKIPIIASSISSALAFSLLLILWRGDTNAWESLVVFPAGFGTGIANSAVFIGLTSGVAESDIAIAGSGLYLSSSIGAVGGISAASAIYQLILQRGLQEALHDRRDGHKILRKALSDIDFVQKLSSELRQLLIPAFVNAIRHIFVFSLVCSILSLSIAIWTRERRLR